MKFWLPPPKSKSDVQQALRFAYEASTAEYMHLSMYWAFCHWFMRGMRNFTPNRMGRGVPSLPMRDSGQRRRVRCEKALVQAETEMGRILGIDVGPAVNRRPGIGLDSIREDSISQAVLDDCALDMLTPQHAITQAYHLVTYGTVGTLVCQQEAALGSWHPGLQLIPAWELRPFPGSVSGMEQLGGDCWFRWVPIEWLRQRYKGVVKVPRDLDKDAGVKNAPFGSAVPTLGSPFSQTAVFGGIGGPTAGQYIRYQNESPSGPNKDSTEYGEVREWWLLASPDRVARYVLQVGDSEPLIDIDYTQDEWLEKLGGTLPLRPLNTGRYYEVGSYWGRAFVDRLIPINREAELLMADWLDNLRTVDRLRFLTIPRSSGFNLRDLAEARKNKVLFYNPDLTNAQIKPDVVGPPNTGDAMGKTIGMLLGTMDSLGAQGELVYGGVPKNVDSARALAVIGQYQNLPIAVVGESLAGMYRGVWRATLNYVRFQRKINPQPLTIPIRRIDEMCIGLVIDRKSGRIALGDYAIPEAGEIDVTVRSKKPAIEALMEEKIFAYRKEGVLSQVGAMIELVRNRVEGPRVDRVPYYNYVVAWLENALIYNDGKTPGHVTYQSKGENHLIHFMVISEVVASPAYYAASEDVQKVLLTHKDYHAGFLPGMPEGAPSLDSLGQPTQLPAGLAQQFGQPGPTPAGLDTGLNTLALNPGQGG